MSKCTLVCVQVCQQVLWSRGRYVVFNIKSLRHSFRCLQQHFLETSLLHLQAPELFESNWLIVVCMYTCICICTYVCMEQLFMQTEVGWSRVFSLADSLFICGVRWSHLRRSSTPTWTSTRSWRTCPSSPRPNWSLVPLCDPNSTPRRPGPTGQVGNSLSHLIRSFCSVPRQHRWPVGSSQPVPAKVWSPSGTLSWRRPPSPWRPSALGWERCWSMWRTLQDTEKR